MPGSDSRACGDAVLMLTGESLDAYVWVFLILTMTLVVALLLCSTINSEAIIAAIIAITIMFFLILHPS